MPVSARRSLFYGESQRRQGVRNVADMRIALARSDAVNKKGRRLQPQRMAPHLHQTNPSPESFYRLSIGGAIMSSFVDDTARILGDCPMPRRQALRLVGGTLFAGILGILAGCGCTASHCTKSGETSYCVAVNACCPDGYTLSCGGQCFTGPPGSCPSNLRQQSICGPEC